MTEATIRARLKTVLDGVTDIGRTYDYFRHVTETTERDKRFLTSSGIFHTWQIQLEDSSPIATVNQSEIANYREANADAQRFRIYRYRLWGYYAVNDELATEKTMIAITESVIDALDEDTTLHGAGDLTYYNTTPAQLAVFGFTEYAGILCHGAQVTVTIESVKGS